ncbi:MAG: DMT family transporter [Gemmatimonadota bacterium]
MTGAAAAPSAGRRAPVSPSVVLFISVLAMSWAAPLIRFATADALAISFWRVAIALPCIAAMLTLRREWSDLAILRPREWATAILAGVFLAGHFATWIASVALTSVAASVALVATQPVWVAIFALVALGERPSSRQWAGIVIAVLGAGVIGWGDLGGGADPIRGDLLALAGAMLVAGYYVIGRNLRVGIGLWPYVGIVYGAAAVTLLLALLSTGQPVFGPYPARDWLVFLGLAAGPMMIGHTGQNWALRYLPAYAVNLTLLGEPLGATIIAWLLPAIAETPPVEAVLGGTLILTGILLGLRRR